MSKMPTGLAGCYSALAVRVCKLNLCLAGFSPAGRAYPVDALDSAPPALARARQEYEEGQLGLF